MTAEESVSDTKSNDPSATGVREAVLVLDTKAEAPALGLRDTGRFERCLLFRADGAYVQVRVPPASPDPKDRLWIYGQYVPTRSTSTDPDGAISPRVSVAVVGGGGGDSPAAPVGPYGAFALACDPAAPFWLEFRTDGGTVVRARFDL